MRVAYADPPYEGVAHRYPEKQEVDHPKLIARLVAEYPEGWALSCKANSVRNLWPICPADVRLAVWAKTWTPMVHNVRPGYAWEGVLFRGGRRTDSDLERDVLFSPPTMNQRVLGTKPPLFCAWVFRLLGMQAGDLLDDLYPGSGAVSREWEAFQRQLVLTGF
jgi:hypothetical protein